MRIAFLGLGRMGQALATHITTTDHELTVWNRSPGKAGDLVAAGATEAGSVADAGAGADLVLLMLFGPDAVSDVLGDVLDAAPQGAVVCDCSTVGPAFARESAERVSAAGLRYLDAPVAGSVGPAEKGELGVLVGGPDDAYEVAAPVLSLWAGEGRLRHLGPAGSGSAMKLVINSTLATSMTGIGEALRLAADLGLAESDALDVVGEGPYSWTLAVKRGVIEGHDTSAPQFALDALAKDVRLALAQADRPLPALEASLAAIESVGMGGHDYAAIATGLAGTEED